MDDANTLQLKPRVGQVLRSKRVRLAAVALCMIATSTLIFYHSRSRLSLTFLPSYQELTAGSHTECPASDVDWSRFAYTQYVTNTDYLCNSVMLFEILHRLGSKADRLMMYPSNMHPDPTSSSIESRLLLKAQDEYGVKLMPIEVQHRDGNDGGYQRTPRVRCHC